MFGGEEGDVPKAASELLAAVQAAADSARAADARPANLSSGHAQDSCSARLVF
jgi:hypothetical protein